MKAASCNHYAKSRLNYGLPPRRRNKQTNVHNSIIALPNGGSHIIGLFDIEKSAQPQFFGPMWVITHSPSTFRSSGVLTKIATTTLMCIKPMLLLKSTTTFNEKGAHIKWGKIEEVNRSIGYARCLTVPFYYNILERSSIPLITLSW